jgi:outer membrane protein TolC
MLRRISLVILLSGLNLLAYNQTRNLEYYLTEGIRNSPLLYDYKNQISSSTQDSLIIHAAGNPIIEAKSQLLYSPYYHNFGYDEVVTDGGNYTAVISVNQNIFNKKEKSNKYRLVDLQKQLLVNSTQVSSSELVKIITDQYLSAFSVYNDLTFNTTFLDLFNKENAIVKQFVQNGVYKQTDYLALIIETQTQEITVKKLESQYRTELSSLNQLCGLNDSARYELSKPEIVLKGTPVISNTPTWLKYRLDSMRIETEKAAIDIKYKPKVNWFADAGFLTSYPWNFYRHFGYSAGISLNIPVYDGKQQGMEKEKLQFEQSSRESYQASYQKQYLSQISQLKNELKALNDLAARTAVQLTTSAQLVDALKGQLESGIIQMTEYINALKNYKTISSSITIINVQKLQIINELNFLSTK